MTIERLTMNCLTNTMMRFAPRLASTVVSRNYGVLLLGYEKGRLFYQKYVCVLKDKVTIPAGCKRIEVAEHIFAQTLKDTLNEWKDPLLTTFEQKREEDLLSVFLLQQRDQSATMNQFSLKRRASTRIFAAIILGNNTSKLAGVANKVFSEPVDRLLQHDAYVDSVNQMLSEQKQQMQALGLTPKTNLIVAEANQTLELDMTQDYGDYLKRYGSSLNLFNIEPLFPIILSQSPSVESLAVGIHYEGSQMIYRIMNDNIKER